MSKLTHNELSAEAKEMFLACKKEIMAAVRDELEAWNLDALIADFGDDHAGWTSSWHLDKVVSLFTHAPSLVLSCGANRSEIPALRATLKRIVAQQQRWQALEKREEEAKRTVTESPATRLNGGRELVEHAGAEMPF